MSLFTKVLFSQLDFSLFHHPTSRDLRSRRTGYQYRMTVDAYQHHHWRSAMASADVNGVAGKSWATNKSTSARSTTVAFYPRVTRGVIYISARKAVVYRAY